MADRVAVAFLFWRECPSHEEGLRRLRQAAAEEGIELELSAIEVKTDEGAQRLRFIGSPTFRIEGQDLDPEGADREPCRLTCRLYVRSNGLPGPLPDLAQLRHALRRAADSRTENSEEG